MKTEDAALLKKEVNYVRGMTGENSPIKKFIAALGYRLKKKKLLEERDRVIAENISRTLRDGETGILFLGAYHNILDKLPEDIAVEQLKDRDKVEEYQRILPYRRKEERFSQLAEYISAPIN